MEFVFVKKIVDEWAKMGHRCFVISTDFSWVTYLRKRIQYRPKHYRDEVAQNVYVDVYNPRVLSLAGFSSQGVSFERCLMNKFLERTIKNIGVKIDFVYCHFFNSAISVYGFIKNNHVPFFIASGESTVTRPLKPFKNFSWEQFKKVTTGVIAVSNKNRTEALELGLISEDKCEVFPNGTNLELFRKLNQKECRAKLGFPQNCFIVVCVGFFCERKGQNRVLEAIRKLNCLDIKVIFLGREAKKEGLELEGEEILYKGAVFNEQIPEYLCSADVFCLPTRHEGCCNAIIEAMACGCPIISSNRPFNHDVLNNGNSILVEPDDIDAISAAIKTLYSNPKRRSELSEKSLERAASLGIVQRAEGIMEFIESRI